MPAVTQRLFVYGTLKPGRERWPLLEPHLDPSAPVVDDAVDGRLWATPWGWPALTPGPGTVPGVVVSLASSGLDRALDALDEVEGVGSGLFVRELEVAHSGTECWVYVWPNSTDGFEPVDGAW